ncbi:uncharacterized protein LOC133328827 [Musca vetustissima]|uniref:uncharacterized protein LOC133328827 n=1 Tax=Musca vetustissima TaxID=27455 RepID=UPI002AB75747|nr:uncharacterized protein LOC133328827 [Musca vetustissima]
MRAFIVLCLVAAACAQYNYQPTSNIGSGIGGGISSGVNYGSAPAAAPLGDFPVASNDSPAVAPQAELEKEFYTFSANDNDFNDPAASEQLANSVKQGLRVIFIKGPENSGLEDAALALAKQAAQQETAIYVLNKQADLSDLANKLNNINTGNNNKPEVHFVKYRTPEDAANAQRAIQGQYDSLGGKSQNFNGGVAPVINFASQPAVRAPATAASTPGASYLPASIFRA